MSFFAPIPPPFAHQSETTAAILAKRRLFVMSDAGTGKSRATLDAISAYRQEPGAGRVLIFAPKSALTLAWGNDSRKFTPHLSYTIADAKNRLDAIRADSDFIITNHDAAKPLADAIGLLRQHNIRGLVIDESTCAKHATSTRSKSLKLISESLDLDLCVLLSATPNMNNPLHIWHQMLLLDGGQRLGKNYYRFRQAICDPSPRRGTIHMDWIPRPEANEAIAGLLDDITIRHKFEECIDIPPHSLHVLRYTLTPKLRMAYERMRKKAILQLNDTDTPISAVNAAALHGKLLQVSSGSVYDDLHTTTTIDTDRYELIRDLVAEREQCVVPTLWNHQREALCKIFDDAEISYGILDGSIPQAQRERAVNAFNAKQLRVLFIHPLSGAHSLTLTAGTSTIWPGPISNAELWTQFNRRIYRAGQTRKTETLVILADDTLDEATYNRCIDRVAAQQTILEMLQTTL